MYARIPRVFEIHQCNSLTFHFRYPLAIVRTDIYIGYMNKSPATEVTPTTPDSEIADRILTALSDKDLTQEALAQEIGISYSTLRRSLEQHRGDRRSFTILELGKIASILDVSPAALLPATLTQAA